MKNKLFLAVLATVTIFAASCKKDSSNKNGTVTFTVDGTTFTQVSSSYQVSSANNLNYPTLSAIGKNGSKKYAVALFFGTTSKPTAGSYKIVDGSNTIASGEVALLVSDSLSVAKEGLFTSKAGSSATVTVSGSGKLTVVVPSITLKGTNFDNSDPNNTVTTDATVTASGTVGEN